MSMKDLSGIVLNHKYQLKSRIGSGSYGIVYSAVHLYTGTPYAIKIILKNNSANTANNKQLLVELEKNLIYQSVLNNGSLNANLLNLDSIEKFGVDCKFLREISLQLKVHKHPNVLSIYKVYDFQNSIFVVMDYFPEGDLFTTIVDKQRYKDDPFLIKSVFIQLIDAINYCHSKHVFHCDLKPENVLVADNGTKLVLADFGLALQDEFINSNISCGSSYYMSPERIQNFSQAFNTLESHSIHLERLLNPSSASDFPHHGNVKFPTSAGDVWSLAIILINLISIRNPWLKASLQDTTFKAFVSNPKILMKILPISNEVFHVLINYLSLNPWERGSLFQFREDVLTCSQLTETGPLSINSRISSMDIITTESQLNVMNNIGLCPIPIDHVQLDKMRNGENEIENDYLPNFSGKNDVLNAGGVSSFNKANECKSCTNCGFGYDEMNACGNKENSNVVSGVENASSSSSSSSYSSSHSSYMNNTSRFSNDASYEKSTHYENQYAQHNYNSPHQQQQPVNEPKHENLLKKFFKYGPGGYNPANHLQFSRGSSTEKIKHRLSPFSSKSSAQQQQERQQEEHMLLLQQEHERQQQQLKLHQLQQQQRQQQAHLFRQQQQQQQARLLEQQRQYQQQALEQQRLLEEHDREQQQQRLQHQLEQQSSQQQQQQQQQQETQEKYDDVRIVDARPHVDQHPQRHHHHHHRSTSKVPSADSPIPPGGSKLLSNPKPIADYKSIFPMPGMGHNKILTQNSQHQRRKLITKRRQRRSSTMNNSSSNKELKYSDNKATDSSDTYNEATKIDIKSSIQEVESHQNTENNTTYVQPTASLRGPYQQLRNSSDEFGRSISSDNLAVEDGYQDANDTSKSFYSQGEGESEGDSPNTLVERQVHNVSQSMSMMSMMNNPADSHS